MLNNDWELNQRRNASIADSDLILRNNNRRAVNSDADGELKIRQTFDF